MPSDDRLLQALGARIGLEQQAHLPVWGPWAGLRMITSAAGFPHVRRWVP